MLTLSYGAGTEGERRAWAVLRAMARHTSDGA